MQPIRNNESQTSDKQKLTDKSQALLDFHLEKGYQCFTRHFRSIKRENMRPVTHLMSHAPISQKSMTLGDLGDSEAEDYIDPKERRKLKKNEKDFNVRN